MSDVELRTYTYIDVFQPQVASFLATVARGFLPTEEQAALIMEIAPGMGINRVMDIALKRTDVKPGMMIVERVFGMLEVHSFDQGEVREAGRAILEAMGLEEQERLKPKVMTSEAITNVSPYHATLVNRNRNGNMLLGGQTLYILEVHPAGYAALAANEAEKASPISIIEVRPFGAFGRVWLSGTEAHVAEAAKAAIAAIEAIDGRANSK